MNLISLFAHYNHIISRFGNHPLPLIRKDLKQAGPVAVLPHASL